MAINVDNLLVDRILRGTLFDKSTGDVIFTNSELENPSLKCGGTSLAKNDAQGTPIATFYRAKTAEISSEASMFSLGIAAAQFGSEREVASAEETVECPKCEIIKVGATAGELNTTIVLSEIPVGTAGSEIPFIYIYNSGNRLGKKYSVGQAASATAFTINAATKTITLPTDNAITADTQFIVWYNYMAESAVYVDNNSSDSPKAGRYDLEVIFCDPCNQSTKYYGHILFGNAQLSPETDIPLKTDSTHPFTITAARDYCTDNGRLFRTIVPE